MIYRHDYSHRSSARQARHRNAVVGSAHRQPKQARRSIDGRPNVMLPFAPPEDWYESSDRDHYRVVVQAAGEGYRHVVSETQVRDRLAQVPAEFLEQLEVVQFSRMTRKKQSFPCYGMQWGNAIYLYPLEDNLVEYFYRPPRPALVNETKMFGGRWASPASSVWTLNWTPRTAQDFYLNNVLIHELGHLLDERNSSYMDRERYAEWFAIQHGYRRTGGAATRRPRRQIRKRHHAC
jgi:hypothetical protein